MKLTLASDPSVQAFLATHYHGYRIGGLSTSGAVMFNSVKHCLVNMPAIGRISGGQIVKGLSCLFTRATRTIPPTLFGYHHIRMAKDIIEQVEPHIREILRICLTLNVEGWELLELNALVRRTSKLAVQLVIK
jgi:hypothetical protein